MKATETTLASLLSGKRQYQIPIFQRSYSLGPKHFKQLWDDVAALAEEEQPNTHFIGSVMLAPAPGSTASFPKWWVVDGQQRLTTLTVLLAALRDHQHEHDEGYAYEQISEEYLSTSSRGRTQIATACALRALTAPPTRRSSTA